MLIDDEGALRDWLVATLEPLCDAEPIALARYVLALVAKDKPLDKLRENCIDRLEVFLDRATKDFVDQLFDVIRNGRYIPEGKKENVQPKPSESPNEITEIPEQQNPQSPTKEEGIESTSLPITTSGEIIQPVKRRYSARHPTNVDNSNRHQPTSHKRQSAGSPPAKRTQRSYSHSSTDSSPSTPTNTNVAHNKNQYDHTSNALAFEQQNYYPSYQQYDNPSSHHHHQHQHAYNPEAPDFKYNPHQSSGMYMRQPMPIGQSNQQQPMMNPQRTLVTVVTNAEPLPLEQNNSTGGPMPSSMNRIKRHIITAPYPTDKRIQQRDHQLNQNNDNHYNRGRKRPWQKPDGPGSASSTLEIRKIPAEFNTISKLNEHFSKFGTVTNVQIAYDGSPDSALIAYSAFHEAETAYKNPEPLFNNRFIKIFWHNSNKGLNSTNNTNPNQSSSDTSSTKKPVPNPMKHHWTKIQKPSPTKNEAVQPPLKKKPTIPPGPSIIKKEAAKKASIEIRRKKQGLLEEQIQQQKLLFKKLESSETNEEKESIRSLMKQVDSTIVKLKDSLRPVPIKSATIPKISQQDVLKQRTQVLQKQIDSLRAKTSADMRRAMTSTLETKLPNQNRTNDTDEDEEIDNLVEEENRLLTDNDKTKVSNESNQHYELETHDEAQLLDS